MNNAVILHTVEDAEYCLRNNLHNGTLLFSTHSSVDVYLKELYNVKCECLSNFLSNEEISKHTNISSDMIDRMLSGLDEMVSPVLNEQFKLKMKYFTPLYSYIGKHHLLGYMCFAKSINKIIEIYKFHKISFFNQRLNTFLDTSSDIKSLVKLLFASIEVEVIEYPNDKNNTIYAKINNITKRFKGVLCDIGSVFRFIKRNEAILRYLFISKNKKNILIYEPLHYLWFLRKSLSKYNIFYYADLNSKYPAGLRWRISAVKKKVAYQRLDLLWVKKTENSMENMLLNDIKEDFFKHIAQYLESVLFIKKVHKKYPLSLGIWGIPGGSQKCLIFEYLKSEGIKILGAQHGNTYTDQFFPWAFEAVFNRCDYFISWGVTKEDLFRIFPNVKPNIEIFPLGRVPPVTRNSTKKRIGIVFPLTNSISIFNGGVARSKPDKLTERQIKLLTYLNSLQGIDVYIKPFPSPTYANYSVLPVLKKLTNLIVIKDVSFSEFLGKYSSRIIIVEYPSSPLYDVLHLDTEIFLMDDDIKPYEPKALEELKKRVHYSENTDEIISKIDLFLKGNLEKKRDNTFYNHYVHKGNTKENIINLINSLAEK